MPLADLELFSEAELDSMLRILERYMIPADRRNASAGPASPKRAVGTIIFNVLFYGLLLCLVGGAFLLSLGDKKPIFGYSFMNVISTSMQSVYPVGTLVIVKAADEGTIQIGDDITFVTAEERQVTHRVIGIEEENEGSGERGYETKGVDNEEPDREIVREVNVVGVVKFHVPKMGQWLEWLRGNLIITLCFSAGIVLLAILLKGAFKKSPESQNEEERKGPQRRPNQRDNPARL